jgi:hypothetical protein
MSEPVTPRPSGLRALLSRESGALFVHVHTETGVEHRTIVLSPTRVRLLRWLVSPWSMVLGVVFTGSWIFLAVLAARLPATVTRVAELELEAVRLDTLEAHLMDLQLRYDQVTRMLGAAPKDSTTTEPPPAGSPR